jgi:Fe2+ transport system protein FeoA
VCPPEWGEQFGLVRGEEVRLNNASGVHIPHYGSRETVFKTKVENENKSAEDKLMSMGFEVSEVKKALAAVVKICEKGNLVQFGFNEGESFIQNKKTGDKVFLKRQGGSYVLDVEFESTF